MTITQCISFLITSLSDLLTTDLLFPFVGTYLGAMIIYVLINIIRRR